MPVENKRNYENEEIHEDKLDHWYGSIIEHSGFVRMIAITIGIIIVSYGIFKLVKMIY